MSLDSLRPEHQADSKRPLLAEEEGHLTPGTPKSSPLSQPRRGRTFLTHGKSTQTLTSEEAECARGKFEFPTSRELCLIQIALCLGYCAYMLTSWLDTTMRQKLLFPVCKEYWRSSLMPELLITGCVGSILIFWLFPIFCCLILLLYLYRDLLQTRIYYIMLAHQVHLDFTNVSFFNAISVRVMLVWCALCLLMYPLSGTVTFYGFMQTLPFWIPVVSFGTMLYSQWDIEKRLVSVPKLVKTDVEWAGRHVRNSFFLRDYIAERVFHKVRKEFDKQKPPPQLQTGEYIQAICSAAEEDHRKHLHDEIAHDQDLKRRAHITIFYAVSPWYWMRQFLYCNYLVDIRAKNFHAWFQLYFCFTCLLALILSVFAVLTVITHLDAQDLISAPRWMTLQDVAIVPLNACTFKDDKDDSNIVTGLVQMASGALRGTGSAFLGRFQAQGALQEENAALLAQNSALQRQSEAQMAQVAALLAEVATLRAGVPSI